MTWDDDIMVSVDEVCMITGADSLGDIAALQKQDPTLPTPYWFADGSRRIYFQREQLREWQYKRMDKELEMLSDRS